MIFLPCFLMSSFFLVDTVLGQSLTFSPKEQLHPQFPFEKQVYNLFDIFDRTGELEKLDPETLVKFKHGQERFHEEIQRNQFLGRHSLSRDFYYSINNLRYCYRKILYTPIILNYAFIVVDPYVDYWRDDVDRVIGDDQVLPLAFLRTYNLFAQAARSHPAFSSDREDEIINFRRKLANSKPNLKKRFLRVCDHWVKHDQTIIVPEELSQDKVLEYRRGEAFLRVLQNYSRCSDGLIDYLFLQERKYLYGESIEDEEQAIPFGSRLAKVFLDYKLNFLMKHRIPGSSEEATTAPLLLRQRMRLPLGLTSDHENVLYPRFGEGFKFRYTPSKVMNLFMQGGILDNAPILPYSSPQTLIHIVQEAVQDPTNKFLTLTHLSEVISQDATLCHYCTDTEENDYYDPNNLYMPYKSPTFQRVLQRYGYLLPILTAKELSKQPILMNYKKALTRSDPRRKQARRLHNAN